MESYRSFRKRLDNNETTCVEEVATRMKRIEEGRHLNAFLSLLNERALKKAEEVDKNIVSGNAGPLAGMTVAIKDNIAIKDELLTCGSKILEGFTSLYSATAVRRLEEADAIVLGKTNLDEFAMGSSNENSYFGPALNPLDEKRVPGGSSGGSAVAVAANMTHTALGSETGGSVRQPAAFTGVVGVKPTYGRVSRYGLTAFASSLDQIGPIGSTVYDAAALLNVIAGRDSHDATSSGESVPDYLSELEDPNIEGLTFGVPKEYFIEGMDSSVLKSMETLKEKIVDGGAKIVEMSLPHTEYVIPTYYVIATAEASSNLARYDGSHFGYRSPNTTSMDEMYELSRSEGFGEEVKRRIMLGTYVLSSGYYDAYYKKAQQVRTLICQDFADAFQGVDLILTPTTPTPAFGLGEKNDDPIAMYLSDIFTAASNIAGTPAISVPFGRDESTNMPLGVQLIAPHFGESVLFRGAEWIERHDEN